jgi:NTE family protein
VPVQKVCLVLSGGVALGAYQAGAFAALHAHEELHPHHIAGSSVGAVNAALIAGNPPAQRVARLRQFWDEASLDAAMQPAAWPGLWQRAYSRLAILQGRLFGRPGIFQPRLPELVLGSATSLYDFAPLRARLERLVDFGRLNGGGMRVSVVTTDIETGEKVVFDTRAGERIGPDHLLASCGFLPEFPPLEIGGRLLGDGGLVANAPIEVPLEDESDDDLLCFLVDLFCAQGARPRTLEEAAGRQLDLLLANQTRQALKSLERAPANRRAVKILHLSYRPPSTEVPAQKHFDFSGAALEQRWQAGRLDMEEAIGLASETTGTGRRAARGVRLSVWS